MSSRSGRRSRSGSRSRESRRSGRRDRDRERDRPWLKKSGSRNSSSSSSSSRSRSSRRRNRRSRSKSPVRPVMSKDPKFVNARVFVAGIASDKANSTDLHRLFEKHGKIVDTLVHHNGYGFVQFVNEEDARKSIELENGTQFHGKTLRCKMAAEGKKDNEEAQRGGGGDRGGVRGGGPGPQDYGGGRGGPGLPPPDDRFGRDPYGPPPMGDPFLRGRDLPPPPRDYRGLPPPPMGRDFGDLPPDYPPRGFRDPRDLPPPPRDPIFDDPYRRPPPPDLYYDRYRDDPFRRDPYRLDPFREPYRDPYGPSLLDPVAPAPAKKAMAVDCEIIVMSSELRRYADMVDKRLKNINLLTGVVVLREDQTIQGQVEDAARRSCLFAITVNSQNEFHRSLTLNILHGLTQEHRNMPLDDAVDLVGRSFEKFLTAEKEKLAAQIKEKTPPDESSNKKKDQEKGDGGGGGGGPPHPKDVGFLLNLLVDNRPLTVEELDKLMAYLQDKRDRATGSVRTSQVADRDVRAASPGMQQLPPQQQPSQYQQQQQQTQYQQPQQYQNQQPQQQLRTQPPQPQSSYQQTPPHQPSYQQTPPQPSYQQTPPQSSYQPQHQQQQQQQQQQQSPSQVVRDIQSKVLSMMNGGASAAATNSLPQTTLTSHTTPLLPATVAARPPPPPPPPQQSPPDLTPKERGIGSSSQGAASSAHLTSAPSLGSYMPAASLAPSAAPHMPRFNFKPAFTSAPGAVPRGATSAQASSQIGGASSSVAGAMFRGAAALQASSSSQGASSSLLSSSMMSGIPATLINFDNPTVQQALDNLIQSGSSLLKNITGAGAGQTTSLATSSQPQSGGYRGPGQPPQPPY